MTRKAKQAILAHWNIFSITILMLGAAWIWISAQSQQTPDARKLMLPNVGFGAPEIELVSLSGDQVKLSQFRGKPVILNFWASWCQPCRIEMPAIQRAYEKHAEDGLVILAVNMTNQDRVDEVRAFVDDLNLTFTILLDEAGEAGADYRISALPTTFFIDTEGVISEVVIGGPMAEALLLTRIENLLKTR